MNNSTPKALVRLLLYIVFLTGGKALVAQTDTISAVRSIDGDYLIQEVFLGGGECFEVFNIQLTGQEGQAGVFSNGQSSIGFESGIILSNGNVEEIMGPNLGHSLGEAETLSTGYGVTTTDPDLATLSALEGDNNSNFFDPVVLEFDFTPTLDSIAFEFVFASEEYCQFSLSSFIDLFGFFIDGPGINGPFTNNGINIAVVPGTNQAITARSISPFFNNSFYRNNIPPGRLGCSLNQAAPAADYNAFDGFTVPLVASARVIPCETYHIKLVVSDRGFDDQLDAAVFLKANSFAAGLTSRIASQVNGPSQGNDSPYEGCGSTSIIFTRGDSVLTDDLTVFYDLLPGGTATPGLDYTPLPDSVIIPAGVFADTVIINFFEDNITEGTESFTIKLKNPCDCSESELTINILEATPLSGSIIGPDTICAGEGLALIAVPSGGTGNVFYQWDNGDQDSLYNGLPITDDTITLVISDECGSSETLQHVVHLQSPSGTLDGNFVLCDGRPSVVLPIELTDGTSFTFDFLDNGVPTTYTNVAGGTFQIPILTTGVYEISNLSADGCPGTTNGEAQVLVVDINTTAQIDSIDCFGNASGSIALNPTGGTGVYSYIWSHEAGLDTSLVENLTVGDYNIFISDSNGCLDTLAVTLDQPPLLEIGIDTLNLFANCQQLGSLTGSASGGVAPYTFNWSDGGMTAQNDNLTSGDYTLSVTDGNNCLRTVSAQIIGDSIFPVIQLQALDSLDCATASITIDASGSSQNGNYTYQWIDDNNNIIPAPDPFLLSVNTPGVYTLSILDMDNNCESSASIAIDNYPSVLTPQIGGLTTLTCQQDTIDLTIANPDPDWTISWENIFGTVLANDAPNLSVIDTGSYVLVAQQMGTNCFGRDTISIAGDFVAPELILASVPDTLDCGTNQVAVDANVVSGSGSYNYQWSGPAGGILGNDQGEGITVVAPGVYQLILEDLANGCTDTLASTILEDLTSLTIDPLPDTLLNCTNTTIELTATSPNTGNLSFSWEDASGNTVSQEANAQINEPGTYLISLTSNDNSCSATTQVQVMIDTLTPRVTPVLPDDLSCNLDTITLSTSPGLPHFTPIWRNAMGDILPSTTWEQVVTQAGGYSLTVRDELNGCRSTILFEVGIDTIAPQISIAAIDTLTCAVDTINIAPLVSNGSGNYDYSWNGPPGGITSPITDVNINVVLGGAYVLTVTDQQNGCRDTLAANVLIDRADPVIEAINDTLINCYQPDIVLLGNSTSSGTLIYRWIDENQLTISNTSVAMIDQEGTYTLQVTNTANGCSEELAVQVMGNFASPIANAGENATIGCATNTANLQGVTGPINWVPSWSDPNGLIVSNGEWTLTTSLPGNYQLNVIDTLNGCTATDVASIFLDQDAPIAEAGPVVNALDCFTGNIIIDASASSQGSGILYTILDGNGAIFAESSSPSFTINTPGSYQLLVIDTSNDCQALDAFEVVVDEPIIETVTTNNIACNATAGSIVFETIRNGTPPYLYSIDGGNNFLNQNAFTNLPVGAYNLIVQDLNGCEAQSSTSITEAPGINVFLEEQVVLKLGELYVLNPQFNQPLDQIASITWSADPQLDCTDCLNPTFTAQQTTYLELTVVDINGCTASTQILLLVDETVPVFVPNVFSPNNLDGVNDRFTIYGDPQQIAEVIALNIFDRWGGLVFTQQNFQINDPTLGWDGRVRGKTLNKAIFVYWAELLLQNGERIIVEGDVLLMD